MLYARGRGDDPNLGDRHASSLESLGVYGDLMAKGQTAMQAADEKMHQNRADAAYVIVRRHINEIDTAIAKVERDARITGSDQAKTIHALREYRTVFQDASVKMRAMKDIQAQFGR